MFEEIVRDSGLVMKTQVEGSGPKPSLGQTVVAHYEIFFGEGSSSSNYDYDKSVYIDELYDSTYEDKPFNGPIEFVIGQETAKDDIYKKGDSVKGFDEAFLDMRVGEKRDLFVPSHLAYGDEGASSFHTFFGYRIAPDRNVNCTVELVEIKDSPVSETPARGPAYEG
jgi:FKBP-type peptidyl-prolyl cis-trans isomerase|tara:strand:- start:8386 stop:8886 length:501 start_codon:yes stop_codon:yes gene_type:complete